MLIHALVLLLVGGDSVAVEAEKCPEPIEAVMTVAGLSSSWVGVLVMDATDDGVPEIFISSPDRGGNAGEPWQMYYLGEAGRYEAVGTVFFHPHGFRLEGARLETYWRSNATSGRFITYSVSSDSIEEVERTDLLYSGEREFERRWKRIVTWRPNLQGKYYAAKGGGEHFSCRSLD